MEVILPDTPPNRVSSRDPQAFRAHPWLLLLHGLSDDHTTWQRRTSIERYVAPLGLAVVMPNVHRSFYTDMVHGYPYWTFVSEEVPARARSFFPLSARREDTFVAGLSMGGYGAFKLALAHPERFAAAASLSGVLDLVWVAQHCGEPVARDLALVFGKDAPLAGSDADLMALAARRAERPAEHRPALFQCCGTEDHLYHANQRFREHARRLGLGLTYEEGPGSHEWGYWDDQIQRVLNWLPLPSPDHRV